jgi:hypothetical protein
VLAQVPSVAELVGVSMVIAGVAVHREAGEAAGRGHPQLDDYAADAGASAVIGSASGSGSGFG